MMLQRDDPRDYVVGTGQTYSVENLVERAFAHAGLDWKEHVEIDPNLIRPAEVDLLCADPAKANEELGWQPEVDFDGLVRMMVEADIERLS